MANVDASNGNNGTPIVTGAILILNGDNGDIK
jgi:hypothetical protein